MKTSVVLISVGLVVVALAVLFLGGPEREYTTNSAEAYTLYEQGNAHLLAFQFSQANAALNRAVELDPGFVAAYALLSQARYRVGQRDGAQAAAAIADSLLPGLSNKLERAKIQLTISGMTGIKVAARDSLIAYVLAEQPDNVQALSILATVQSNDDPEAAEATYAKLLAIEPNHAPAYNMLGYLAAHRGEYDTALAHLRKYAFMAPDLANPHDSLGEVLVWTGQYAEAEREFETAVRIQPDFYYSEINLGEIYMEQGMIERGRAKLEAVRAKVKGSEYEQMIDEILVRILFYHKLYDASLAAIDGYVANHPDAFQTDYYRAIAHVARGEREEAAATIGAFFNRVRGDGYPGTKVYRNTIDIMELRYNAIAAYMDEDYDSAAGNWTQVIALSADEPPHAAWYNYFRLGETRYMQGRYADALDNASKALAHNPNLLLPLMLAAQAADAAGEATITRKALDHLGSLLTVADPDLPVRVQYEKLLEQVATR